MVTIWNNVIKQENKWFLVRKIFKISNNRFTLGSVTWIQDFYEYLDEYLSSAWFFMKLTGKVRNSRWEMNVFPSFYICNKFLDILRDKTSAQTAEHESAVHPPNSKGQPCIALCCLVWRIEISSAEGQHKGNRQVAANQNKKNLIFFFPEKKLYHTLDTQPHSETIRAYMSHDEHFWDSFFYENGVWSQIMTFIFNDNFTKWAGFTFFLFFFGEIPLINKQACKAYELIQDYIGAPLFIGQ